MNYKDIQERNQELYEDDHQILDSDGEMIPDDPGYRPCQCEDYPCCGH